MRLACPALLKWFESGATIVTPTALLAAAAAEQFSRHQLERGRETWVRPTIYSLSAWLVECWREARYSRGDFPTLLSRSQEMALWNRVIEAENPELFDIPAAARLARNASDLLAERHMAADVESWEDHPDGRQFQHWQRLFRRACREQHWVTRAGLWRLLPEWIAGGLIDRGTTAFLTLSPNTPALRSVQLALGDRAVQVESQRATATSIKVKEFDDPAYELEYAAREARKWFEEDPALSIGVFVPALETQHAGVKREFQRVFYPTWEEGSAFHVHAGPALADHPLISGALLLLDLALPRIHHANAGAILRSPFLSGADVERSGRALADLALRKWREMDLSLRDLEKVSGGCPLLTEIWPKVRRVLQQQTLLKEFSEWSEFLGDLVEATGWPGDVELTDQEQQVVEAWKGALSDLSALGLVLPAADFGSALSQLRRLLSKSVEHGDWSSPVQIMDALDAPGLAFDRVLALGLSEDTWPPLPALSPLIPLNIQRANQVPGSWSQSAREERESCTRALFETAPKVVATHTGRLTPLVKKKSSTGVRAPSPAGLIGVPLEQMPDSLAPPLVASGEARGGTNIIKAQSQCPFKAFAEYRLQARAPEDACFGFDARERGMFVHRALEGCWQRLKSQDCLRAMTPADLQTLVKEAVNKAVSREEYGPLHVLISRTERERLEALVLEWLAVERERQQPFTVEKVEEKQFFEVPGLRLGLRIDRIDRLKNGSLILIDYKSGKQSRPKLEGPRPPEPQLLVYAAALREEVAGIFFGQVKPREVKAVGFSREKQFKGHSVQVKKDWDSYLESAKTNVEKLARDFVHGEAAVDPIKQACDYCSSKPLCRVKEIRGTQEEDGNDD